jgi:ABC-2 type transport system ATP-binding protein
VATQSIEFHNVSKFYPHRFGGGGVVALSEVSFEVGCGEVCAFLGPNGAGKTTSISILMGFQFADSGETRVLGFEPGDIRAKEQIGFLPENFAFYKFLTGPKLLRLHMALSGKPMERADALIPELLAQVKLYGYEQLRIAKYSRGMVQRLGIAQALLGDPQLLVLDEPTSGLDPAGRKEVLDLLLMAKEGGKTVFLSSHILSEVEQICDRVVIIDRGRLVRTGRLREMMGEDNRIEIVVDRLPEELEQALLQRGALVERTGPAARVCVDASLKHEIMELFRTAGCDVISMKPLKSTLEELFLKLVKK